MSQTEKVFGIPSSKAVVVKKDQKGDPVIIRYGDPDFPATEPNPWHPKKKDNI